MKNENKKLYECEECCELGYEVDGVGPVGCLRGKILCDGCLESHMEEVMESVPAHIYFDSHA